MVKCVFSLCNFCLFFFFLESAFYVGTLVFVCLFIFLRFVLVLFLVVSFFWFWFFCGYISRPPLARCLHF